MLSFHLVVLDQRCHSHSLAGYGVNFCVFFTFGVNISSVTLNSIKGMLYQETERRKNLREKGPKTKNPFAAHSCFVSSFLPNQLCILIQIQHITYDTLIIWNRELHSLCDKITYKTCIYYSTLFIIQHNFNKNNK